MTADASQTPKKLSASRSSSRARPSAGKIRKRRRASTLRTAGDGGVHAGFLEENWPRSAADLWRWGPLEAYLGDIEEIDLELLVRPDIKFNFDVDWNHDDGVHYLIRWLSEDAVRINDGIVGGWGGRVSLRVRGGGWREFEGYTTALAKPCKRVGILTATRTPGGSRSRAKEHAHLRSAERRLNSAQRGTCCRSADKLKDDKMGVTLAVPSRMASPSRERRGSSWSPNLDQILRTPSHPEMSPLLSPMSLPSGSPRIPSPDCMRSPEPVMMSSVRWKAGKQDEPPSPVIHAETLSPVSFQPEDVKVRSRTGDSGGTTTKESQPINEYLKDVHKADPEGSLSSPALQSKASRSLRSSSRLPAREPKSFAMTTRSVGESVGPRDVLVEFPSPENQNLISRAHCRIQRSPRKYSEEHSAMRRTTTKLVNSLDVIGQDLHFIDPPETIDSHKVNELEQELARLRKELDSVQEQNEPIRKRMRTLALQELERQKCHASLVDEESRILARLRQIQYSRAKKNKAVLSGSTPGESGQRDETK